MRARRHMLSLFTLGLIASAAMPASADSYFYRAKAVAGALGPSDEEPDAFSFGSVSGVEPGAAVRSASVAIRGHTGVRLSVSGGGYQVCSTVACSEMDGQPIQTSPGGPVPDGTRVRLVATPTGFLSTTEVSLTAGAVTGKFKATTRARDTEPDAIAAFPNKGAAAGATVTSETRRLINHEGTTVSVTGASGMGAAFRICSAADCSDQGSGGWSAVPASAPRDSYVQLRGTAGADGSTLGATLSYGTRTATWYVAVPQALGVEGLSGFWGPVGDAVDNSWSVSNAVGTASYSYSGSLPPGTSFNPTTGRLTGTVSAYAIGSFTVTGTDTSDGRTKSRIVWYSFTSSSAWLWLPSYQISSIYWDSYGKYSDLIGRDCSNQKGAATWVTDGVPMVGINASCRIGNSRGGVYAG